MTNRQTSMLERINLLRRALNWKAAVDANFTSVSQQIAGLRGEIAGLRGEIAGLRGEIANLREKHLQYERQQEALRREVEIVEEKLGEAIWFLTNGAPRGTKILALRKGEQVLLVPVGPQLAAEILEFAPLRNEVMQWAQDANLDWEIASRGPSFEHPRNEMDLPRGLVSAIRSTLRQKKLEAPIWDNLVTVDALEERGSRWPLGWSPGHADPEVRRRRLMILLGVQLPWLIPHLHALEAQGLPPEHNPPFGDPDFVAPPLTRVPAEPRKRSVLFVNPAYYNFLHLADALRKRGWDAVSMANKDPHDEQTRYFHGFDLNLFDPDPAVYRRRLGDWFREAIGRFDMFHFHGIGALSFFPDNFDTSIDLDRVPWDVLEMKRRGAKIAYTITGCHDLITQTGFSEWSPSTCPKCPFHDNPHVCSDRRMSAWSWKVRQLADLICIETDPPLDFRDSSQTFREPLSFALDPDHWHPELGQSVHAPTEWLEQKKPGEILIYHSVGNYDERTRDGINVKGTGAVIRAIDRLASEGHPVRILFRTDVPSIHNRWLLAQADIIVDQLNYGRYGATAREGLMLGRPVVGRLNKLEPGGIAAVRCIAESPTIEATEDTIYDVLKRLVGDPEGRKRIGEWSRAHALQWWSKDVLAERYERVYDYLRAHGHPPLTLD